MGARKSAKGLGASCVTITRSDEAEECRAVYALSREFFGMHSSLFKVFPFPRLHTRAALVKQDVAFIKEMPWKGTIEFSDLSICGAPRFWRRVVDVWWIWGIQMAITRKTMAKIDLLVRQSELQERTYFLTSSFWEASFRFLSLVKRAV